MVKRIFTGILSFIIIAGVLLWLTGHGYIFTALNRVYLQGNNTANINDHKDFSTHRIVTKDAHLIEKSDQYNKSALPSDFAESLKTHGTAAFLVLKNDKLVAEYYMNGYNDRSKTNSFSMAKTVLTMLVGIAIEEGYIKSLSQPITDFLPEFTDDVLGKKATIGQLSLMNSGYEWTELYYSPFSPTVELLYGDNISKFLLKGYFSAEPGAFWEYSSASTQLLGIILKRALEKKGKTSTLSEYLSEKIWRPMQMNDDALWHTDENAMELVFCCINTNARNFAKLGLLMLHEGAWDNQQLIPKDFVKKMHEAKAKPYYGYSTWINNTHTPSFYWFSGHLGQYIIVVPEQNIVIVRLGERRDSSQDFRKIEVPNLVKMAQELSAAIVE